jgi:hypothetical protein
MHVVFTAVYFRYTWEFTQVTTHYPCFHVLRCFLCFYHHGLASP